MDQVSRALLSVAGGVDDYRIPRSLRFNSPDSTHLTRTFAVQGNRKTWTWSGWVKRSNLGSDQTLFEVFNGNNDNQTFNISWFNNDCISIGAYNVFWLQTSAVFRDPSAWYHVVCAVDTTQATANNRIRLYVNGVEITVFSTRNNPSQNADLSINQAATHYIGSRNAGSLWLNGYLTEVQFIDGQQLTPTSFGEFDQNTGVWKPKQYKGAYGTNGFYLPFSDNSSAVNLGLNGVQYTGDPYWQNTVLMLNGNGTNGAQNNTFVDSSTNNFAITRNGNTTQGAFSPYGPNWSNVAVPNGSNAITTSYPGLSGSGDYTVSFWVYLNSWSGGDNNGGDGGFVYIYGQGASHPTYPFAIRITKAGKVVIVDSVNFGPTWESTFDYAGSYNTANSIGLRQWHYIHIVRSSGTLSIYANGKLQLSVAQSSAMAAPYTNGTINDVNGFDGYISNFRIATTAITDATPPTAPSSTSGAVLLTCASNRFQDLTGNYTVTPAGSVSVQRFSPFAPTAAYSAATIGGSGYFDGGGDYLSVAASANQDFGSSAFTVEFWWYPTADSRQWFYHASTDYWFGIDYKSSSSTMGLWASSNGSNWNLINADPGGNGISSGTPRMNAWNHVAVGRSSGTWSMWLNGTRVLNLTGITSAIVSRSAQAKIVGGWAAGSQYPVNGYMNDFRVVIGTDVYGVSNSTITVPTAPLTAIANTQLLCNFTNGGIIDSTMMNNLETVGNAQISTAQSRFGGSSMYFDGTGDYLKYLGSNIASFGSGNFTIEFWINAPSLNDKFIMGLRGGMSGNAHLTTGGYGGTTVGALRWASNAGEILSGTTIITDNTWHHCAVVRNGGTVTLYVDGVSRGSGTDTTAFDGNGGQILIGENNAGTNTFTGYLDDLRITRGVARYTGNFTVPNREMAYNAADINVNQWSPVNFSVAAGVGNDSLVDTPTPYGSDTGAGGEVRGNYCTLNPLTTGGGTYTQGNLRYVSTSSWRRSNGTIAVSTGKWYWEVTLANNPHSRGQNADWHSFGFGLSSSSHINATPAFLTDLLHLADNGWYKNFSSAVTDSGVGFAAGDVLSIAVDLDANTFTYRKNNSVIVSGTIGGTPGRELVPIINSYDGNYGIMDVNFGQSPFAYAAPSGFRALCTQNLPTPAVTQANKQFDVVLRNGGGASGGSYSTTVNMSNGALLWDKPRSQGSSNYLVDSVRGITNSLRSNSTAAEVADNTWFTNFGNGSFTTGASDWGTSTTLVDWIWAAGGAGVTNTAGSITSTVSANTTSGFSIVTYTNAASGTVGHGLGVAPVMVIYKDRANGSNNWVVLHQSLGNLTNSYLTLNTTNAVATGINLSAAPTSTVISTSSTLGGSGNAFVAYCFAEVSGYSRFGSYTGNGSNDGPFVFCGFRPAFVMVKSSLGTTGNWVLYDNKRGAYNLNGQKLAANLAAEENNGAELGDSSIGVDFLSNGFKIRNTTGPNHNTNGATYIFAAFAESPFKHALAR